MDIKLHPKQASVFNSEANEILYGGAAGGGKSHVMRVIAIALAMLIPGLQIYLFRRITGDLTKNHIYGPTGFFALLNELIESGHCRYKGDDNCLMFWNGSIIWLCHCQYEKDVERYRGAEIHVLLIDELTHFTATIYRFLRGRMRLPKIPGIPDEWKPRLPFALLSSNPGSIGHTWVKAMFIDPQPPNTCWRADEDDGGMLRQFIPALLQDNPSIEDPKAYAQRLAGLGSPALVEAMLNGSWDIAAGAMFADVWNPGTQLIQPFQIPSSWRIDRSFDWGSSKPFSVGWWAESDGSTITYPDGSTWNSARGSLIRIGEWYGWNGQPDQGLRMLATEIGREILDIERRNGWRVQPGPADSAIYTNENGRCIADDMASVGCAWRPANKSPGSRSNGWQIVRRFMKASCTNNIEEPGLYAFNTCRQFARLMPVVPCDPKKPDDLDTNSEDHLPDEVRYRLLENPPQYIEAMDWPF